MRKKVPSRGQDGRKSGHALGSYTFHVRVFKHLVLGYEGDGTPSGAFSGGNLRRESDQAQLAARGQRSRVTGQLCPATCTLRPVSPVLHLRRYPTLLKGVIERRSAVPGVPGFTGNNASHEQLVHIKSGTPSPRTTKRFSPWF